MAKGDPSLALGTSTMTLLELTSAYAAVAGNRFPVQPTAFAKRADGWFDWLVANRHRLSSQTHADIEALLRRAVSQGTGRAAALSIPSYGKTGTTQDNRDALFVGYADGLVVGVWIGNDDNTPLGAVHGGGMPAQIWRNFMSQALGPKAAPARKKPAPNPSGPVEPLDVPDVRDIPLGDAARLRVENGGATLGTEVNGVPLDLTIDQDGVRIDTDRIQAELDRRRDQAEAARRQPAPTATAPPAAP
jgi:penicillin-binding protein 1A